jgi:hypothetical protein
MMFPLFIDRKCTLLSVKLKLIFLISLRCRRFGLLDHAPPNRLFSAENVGKQGCDIGSL